MSDNYENTLDILPGEGMTKTVTFRRVRQECELCGEPAHYLLTFLLEGSRRNPASKAYGKDDCSWCEDARRFVCKAHDRERTMDGYGWCSSFPANSRYAGMFLTWVEDEL